MSRSTTTLNTSRSNAQTLGRRPTQTPAATPHDPSRSILLKTNASLSQLKPSRSRLPAQTKNLPAEPRTPATLMRRGGNPTINLVSGLNSPAQTPLLTVKRDGKSRLPRAAPTPTAPTPGISNAGTKRLRAKKVLTLQAQTASTPAPPLSSSSSLARTPGSSIPPAGSKPSSSSGHIDPDTTPRKKPSQAPGQLTSAAANPLSSKLPVPPPIPRATQKQTSIAFPSIVEDQTPRRPMTRARSKQILDRSTSSLGVSPPDPSGIPQIKRRPSRVMQLAQAFQQDALLSDSHSSSKNNMLGVTPQRRPSSASNTSLVSPAGSFIGNSPNISALAASLSKQNVQRDRLSRARSSVTDMLRYSTMSSLGGLHWEDGADGEEGLLTDPDSTEAMVADISMSKLTPLKPAVQNAAIALASARANFLNIVQENEAQNNDNNMDSHMPKTVTRVKKRPSFGFLPPATPLSRSRLSTSTSTTQMGQLVAHESQLAMLSASLEQSHQRERDLQTQLAALSDPQDPGGKKTLADAEREAALVDEIRRLEAELDDLKETNIELENALDSARFEAAESRTRVATLQDDCARLSASSAPRPSTLAASNDQQPPPSALKFEKFALFNREISNELSAIKEQLNLIQFAKISLALGVHLLP
ncbi:hypothetical protein PTTG_04777 [Puccinia triticina 1-1 BBBD Race 1]|uniref:Uncharacterized protein n=2 Tax=Puccinia triticina TaxID=208348 RepID=A0A180GT50_PUCT1|nr:uncharacterized protein PtA15_4A594 [Puccinia triticina]OAV95940.1 hypothetical protein PTTG_04777 [Puccinia triticina 1-1 BBBD Race 1]WAQ84143.1 hypothetical protein PtA15_4A594 [Puccinia triticina]WAR54976.1 hypothetical protein PtB15_4B594 [Puccinia triticina]